MLPRLCRYKVRVNMIPGVKRNRGLCTFHIDLARKCQELIQTALAGQRLQVPSQYTQIFDHIQLIHF